MKNPYTISFGKEPSQLVSRIAQIKKIIDDFSEDEPSYQACIISGVRGIGKTVTLSEICNCHCQIQSYNRRHYEIVQHEKKRVFGLQRQINQKRDY